MLRIEPAPSVLSIRRRPSMPSPFRHSMSSYVKYASAHYARSPAIPNTWEMNFGKGCAVFRGGRARSPAFRGCRRRRARPGRGPHPARRRRPQFRRHLFPGRLLSGSPAQRHGRRGVRRDRGGRAGRDRLRARRPRDLHRKPARRLLDRTGDADRLADQAARRDQPRDRRGDDHARPHRRLSAVGASIPGSSRATPSSSMPLPAASASSSRNGRSCSACA